MSATYNNVLSLNSDKKQAADEPDLESTFLVVDPIRRAEISRAAESDRSRVLQQGQEFIQQNQDFTQYAALPHVVNTDNTQILSPFNADSKETKESREAKESEDRMESIKRKPRLFKPSEFSCFINPQIADKQFLEDPNSKIPAEITCVEYLVYYDDFLGLRPGNRANFLQNIQNDFVNLKKILKLNPHVKALLIRELPSENSSAEFLSHLGYQYIFWYDCLYPLLEGSAITHFALRNLAPIFHDEISGGNIRHRGPLNPIAFLNRLHQLGIRFVHLENTDLQNILASDPPVETPQIAAAIYCWVCCFPCALTLYCCSPDIRDPCLRTFDEPSIEELNSQDNKKVAEILFALAQFDGIFFSNKLVRAMAERPFYKQKNMDLKPYTDAFLAHRPKLLQLNEFPFNLATTDSIVEMFQNILRIDVGEHTVELVVSNSVLFSLPVGTIERISHALSKSSLQRLTIHGEKISPDLLISQCEVILEQLKSNTTLLECDILTGNNTLGKNAALGSDSTFRQNNNLFERYVNLLHQIQKLIEKNLFRAAQDHIGVGECMELTAELKEALNKNHTLNEVIREKNWCALYQSKIYQFDLIHDIKSEKQKLLLSLEQQVLDTQRERVNATLKEVAPRFSQPLNRMILSYCDLQMGSSNQKSEQRAPAIALIEDMPRVSLLMSKARI